MTAAPQTCGRACRCACRWRRCPRIRGCGALALRRGRQNGRHSLPRPATHARHDFETECVVARNLDHRRSVADQRALRLVRHAACHVTATPRRARPSCSIEWAQHEARLGRPCLPSLVTYRRRVPGNFPPAPGVAAMASVSGCVVHPPLRIGDGSLSVMKIMFHLPRHTRPSMADRTNTGHGGACYNDTLRPCGQTLASHRCRRSRRVHLASRSSRYSGVRNRAQQRHQDPGPYQPYPHTRVSAWRSRHVLEEVKTMAVGT